MNARSSFIPGLGLLLCGGCLLAVSVPRAADAAGPGTHAREALRTLERLTGQDPAWAAIAQDPLAHAYLLAGAISPDLGQADVGIPSGHSRDLSYHLLDAAEARGPLYRLFALGHLCHQASDASVEGFVTPTLLGSAPLGMFDFSEGHDDALGESEGLVESFGDLILGDWMALVDALYDLYYESDQAKANLKELLEWYCAEFAVWSGQPLKCGAVFGKLQAKLALADDFLAGLSRDEAKALVSSLVDQPPDSLADLLGSGMFDAFAGSMGHGKSASFDSELARLKASPAATPEFWNQYDASMGDLGPSWTLRFLASRPAPAWPQWNPNAIVCGNIESVMQTRPDAYAVVPGLLMDDLSWTDEAGIPVSRVDGGLAGKTLVARVRFFSSLPFKGQVRGVVRRDRPGLDASQDPVLGEASVDVDIDPNAYAETPRSVLTLPFTAEVADGIGFYLELYAADPARPCFTTSWDRLWTAGVLDVDRPLYTDNFGTYGHWPASLPVADPVSNMATLFVKARIAPAGAGIEGVTVTIPDGPAAKTAKNGIAAFDLPDSGLVSVQATAPGYAPHDAVVVDAAPLANTWVILALHALPDVVVPDNIAPAPDCLYVRWDPAPFGDQAATFLATAFGPDRETVLAPEVDIGKTGEGKLCGLLGDGTGVDVRVRARYRDGTFGVDGFSGPMTLDRAGPAIGKPTITVTDGPDCVEAVPFAPEVAVSVPVFQAKLDIVAVETRFGEAPWSAVDPLPAVLDGPGTWNVTLRVKREGIALDAGLEIRVTNGAGLSGQTGPIELPVWGKEHVCPQAPEDLPDPSEGGADSGTPGGEFQESGPMETGVEAGPGPGGGGGCDAGARGTGGAAVLVVLLIAGVGLCRRYGSTNDTITPSLGDWRTHREIDHGTGKTPLDGSGGHRRPVRLRIRHPCW